MKINELAKLYDITAHTLRYYEKLGLITPDYDENGYRNYSYRHLQQLNTIRDLRYFDISIPEITTYLKQKDVEKTKKLLQFEITALNQLIDDSKNKITLLEERLNLIEEAKTADYYHPILVQQSERTILKSSSIVEEEKIDYALKELHKKYEKLLSTNNQNLFGSIIDLTKSPYEYQPFYFCSPLLFETTDSETLPAGTYLSYSFQGDYEQRDAGIEQLFSYLKQKKLQTVSPIYESYLIDFHETDEPREYVTRLEILVNKKTR